MFLHTLGYKTDFIITTYVKNTVEHFQEVNDKRGEKRGKMMKEICEINYCSIKAHIDSYHPTVSHYNVSHAPILIFISFGKIIKKLVRVR